MNAFAVDRMDHGKTLAAVVRRTLNLTWSQAKQLVESRLVKLAGQTCADVARRVKTGQRIEITTPTHKSKKPHQRIKSISNPKAPAAPEIRICYFDDHILVVDKPPGLTTMRSPSETAEFGKRGKKFLPKTLESYLPKLVGDGLPIIAVHRIDKDTSGLVVFARNEVAEKNLSDQFRAHTVERRYLAIVRGVPNQKRVESWIVPDRGDGRRGSGPEGDGQRAVTHIAVVKRLGALTLVECRLETGRTHQVRIHLGEIGCPLAGERIYDRPLHGAPVPDPSGAKRFLLHAAALGFKHPATGKLMKWDSPLPDDMQRIIQSFDDA